MAWRFIFLLLLCLFSRVSSAENGWITSGPYGGYIHSFAFSPVNSKLIFASEFDGLFRSKDQGQTWERIKVRNGEFTIRIHPRKPNRIVAANFANGIFESVDEGETWNLIFDYNFEQDGFLDLEFDPADPEILYAISYYHGIFKSADGGRTWVSKNTGLLLKPLERCCVDTPQIEIDPKNPKTLYVLLPARRIYKTTDGGESWRSSGAGLRLTKPVHALLIDPINTNILYLGGANGVYRSVNAGSKWNLQSCNCAVRSLSLNPRNPEIIFGAGERAIRSGDGGRSWEWFTPHPFIASIFLSIAVHPLNPELVFAGGFGAGISKSSDGGNSWHITNEKVDALNAVRLIVHPQLAGRLMAVAGQQIYVSGDGGRSWDLPMRSRSSAFYFSDVAIHPKNPNLIVAVGSQKDKPGAVVFSKDGGDNWYAGRQFYGVNYGCGRCVAFDPEDQNILYIAPFDKRENKTFPLGIARSTDQGRSWELMNNGLSAKDVWVITIHPRNRSKLFAGTGTGKFFVSDNGGQLWVDRSNGLDSTSIRSVAVDPANSNVLYLSTYSAIFKSSDGGETWERKSAALPKGWFNFVHLDAADSRRVYVAGQSGIFVSHDAGDTWLPFDKTGMGPFAVWNFVVDPKRPNHFYAGTDRGVFRYRQEK